MNKVTNDIYYAGVNDHKVDLFEGQYVVPNGMAYNSYVVMDEKIAVFDTVDARFTHEWLDNVGEIIGDRKPDYLIVQHMEPDHSANIKSFIKAYPEAKIVGNTKTFTMIKNFFGDDFADKQVVVADGDTLSLGEHLLCFVFAPMVHWPEVMVTYDVKDKVLFSADGFGKFGALDVEEDWACEARRYYFGIVGKYGVQVQKLLQKASGLDIKTICPLHGPILKENLGYYLNLYNTWSSYEVETEGIAVFYTSVYGNTKKAVELLVQKLKEKGCPKVAVSDLAREDMAECVEDAFRYGKIILATTTYNADIFPFMNEFINHLVERGYKKRKIGLIENGSWAPLAAKVMKNKLQGLQNIEISETVVSIKSSMNDTNKEEIETLANEFCSEYIASSSDTTDKNNLKALFNIGYGLYVVTCNDGKKDNGLIVNSVTQVTSVPNRIMVTINKENYSHHIIKQKGVLNVNCLDIDAPFKVFENFGFKSGRTEDKFADCTDICRSDNGLVFLPRYINSFISLRVDDYFDAGTHGMFFCSVTEARVMNDKETMSYSYYQNNVKPKPDTQGKKGYVCKVCGYVHEGDTLPDDIVCPLCKHGAADFEPIA